MRSLMMAALAFSLAGCTVYTYYPVSPPTGHYHVHDGHGHCRDCGLYFYEGAYYTAPPYGWVEVYGPAGPPMPRHHYHVHDGHGHCRSCDWYYYHGRWYDYRPAGWFEFYYRN